MEEKFEAVLEVWKFGTRAGNVPGVLAQITSYQLSQQLVEVDLAHTLQRTEGEGGGAGHGGLGVDLGLVGHAQHQPLLKQDPEWVDVVAREVEHDPPRHERVA